MVRKSTNSTVKSSSENDLQIGEGGTKSPLTHINNMWVPGQPLPLCDMTKAEINLSIDWVTCTFSNRRILSALKELKPLEESDEIEIDQDYDESPYIKQGLTVSQTNIKFWTETYDWFKGAKISIGMNGGKKVIAKENMVMISLTGKALLHLREKYKKNSMDVIMWLHSFMYDRENSYETGHFTRIDYAIDVLPKKSDFSLLSHVFAHATEDAYTTTARDGGKIKQIFEKAKNGNVLETIYVGSRKSETFARIYDKRREQIALGNKDPNEEWHRFELETKQERAQKIISRLIENHRNNGRWEIPLFGVIKRFLNFRDFHDCKKLSRIKNASTAYWWNHILSNAEVLELPSTTPKLKPSEERIKTWVSQIKKRLTQIIIMKSSSEEDAQNIICQMFEDGLENMEKDELQNLIDYIVEEKKDLFTERCIKARNAIWGIKTVYENKKASA